MRSVFLLFLMLAIFSTSRAQKVAISLSPEKIKEQQKVASLLKKRLTALGVCNNDTVKTFITSEAIGIDKLIQDTVYGVSVLNTVVGKDTLILEIIAVKYLLGEISEFSGERFVFLCDRYGNNGAITYLGRTNSPPLSSNEITSRLITIMQKLGN